LTDGVDLDGEVRRVDPDRWLASRFITDPRRRADVVALYAFDHQLARAGVAATNPLAAEIRLVWWREAVDEVFAGGAIRRHPTVEALATAVRAWSLPRAPMEAVIEAYIDVLQTPWFEIAEALAWAGQAQGSLAGLAARVLGGEAAQAEPAGLVWGLTLMRRAGKAGGAEFETGLRKGLADARRAARALPAAAFPAALCATLARADGASELEKRARLTLAALTGRL